MDDFEVRGVPVAGYTIKNVNAKILLIKAPGGALGCGYFDIAVADRFDDVLAIVRGVSDYADMLAAPVVAASLQAQALGVEVGMSGADALEKMR